MPDNNNIEQGFFQAASNETVIGSRFVDFKVAHSQGPMSWGELSDAAKQPRQCKKETAPCLLVSSCNTKTRSAVERRDAMTALWIDIDDDNPELAAVAQRLDRLEIETYLIYSTASSCRWDERKQTLNGKRWRVIIPLRNPIPCTQWGEIESALIAQVGGDGCSARLQQILFLPNSPRVSDADAAQGATAHYEYFIKNKRLTRADDLPAPLVAAIQAQRADQQAQQAAAQQRLQQRASETKQGSTRTHARSDDGLIEKINAHYSCDSLVGHWDFNGRAYRIPESTSGSFGFHLFNDDSNRWFSFHESGRYGVETASGRCGDAFDLITHYKYGGDEKAALTALAGIVDPEGEEQRRAQWSEEQRQQEKALYSQPFAKDEQRISISDIKGAVLTLPESRQRVLDYRAQELRRFNLRFGVALIEGKTFIVSRERKKKTGRVVNTFSSKADMAAAYSHWKIPKLCQKESGEYAIKWEKIFPVWMEQSWRRTYTGANFEPCPDLIASTQLPSYALNGDTPFNYYVGASFKPSPGDCAPILEHIKTIWCGDCAADYEYTLNWLAKLVQRPFEQGSTVIVLQSDEGTGKGVIVDILAGYFGSHSVMVTAPEHLAGFNDHLAFSVFTNLNECIWGGNKKLEGTLKSLITDSELLVEKKFGPKHMVANCVHLIVSSNNDWVVPVGRTDRRYFMPKVSGRRIGDFAYFDRLIACRDSGGKEAFIHFLKNRDLSGFDVRAIPKSGSATKVDQKLRGIDDVESWWLDCLESGEFHFQVERRKFVGPDGCDTQIRKEPEAQAWPDDEVMEMVCADLYACYLEHSKARHKVNQKILIPKICSMLGVSSLPKMRKKPEIDRYMAGATDRVRHYGLPSLSQARMAFSAYMQEPDLFEKCVQGA
ncbi:MAG: DUF5906 domain-containing protein [Pseudomonadales bacterium]|nr:DUF5906 domain-containing protein [Pseudomonadales bacterium]